MIRGLQRRTSRKLAVETLEQRRLLVGSVFAGSDLTVLEGSEVALEGTYFAAEGDGEVSWLWEVKSSAGETIATGVTPNFAFTPADNGNFDVTLTITNEAGDSTSDSLIVDAKNVPPKLSIVGGPTVAANAPYVLALSSYDPGADTLQSWTIDWGDGTAARQCDHGFARLHARCCALFNPRHRRR